MQDSIYARAGRPGGLGDILSLDEIVRLSTCSLDNPYGTIDVQLQDKLYRLVKMGRPVPVRTEEVTWPGHPLVSVGGRCIGTPPTTTNRYYIHRAHLLPHLKDLGEVGPELLKWLNDGAQPSGNVADLDEQSGGNASPWAAQWVKDHYPLIRVLAGAERLGEISELIQGSELKFSAVVLVDGIKLYDPGSVPPYSNDEFSRNLKLLYPSFTFSTKRPENRDDLVETISRCYEDGESGGQSECECVKKLPPNVQRLFKDSA